VSSSHAPACMPGPYRTGQQPLRISNPVDEVSVCLVDDCRAVELVEDLDEHLDHCGIEGVKEATSAGWLDAGVYEGCSCK
jgi:hypothetical protein